MDFGLILLWLLLGGQQPAPPPPPAPAPAPAEERAEAEAKPADSKRLELNLLGKTDTAAGESRRNENIHFNLWTTMR